MAEDALGEKWDLTVASRCRGGRESEKKMSLVPGGEVPLSSAGRFEVVGCSGESGQEAPSTLRTEGEEKRPVSRQVCLGS